MDATLVWDSEEVSAFPQEEVQDCIIWGEALQVLPKLPDANGYTFPANVAKAFSDCKLA